MSKIYIYNEPIFQGGALIGNEVIEKTEQQILDDYWDHWNARMIAKFGEGHELITKENCIEDWVAVNWAWEKKVLCYCDLSGEPNYGPEFCEICQENLDPIYDESGFQIGWADKLR